MMGRKSLAPRLFHSLSLQEMVPADHLLRRLNKVVDLSFVRQLCAPFYSHTGQPSVDPVVLLKMMLLGYLYGITSERRLAEECSLHLAFRWYLGYDFGEATPDHSVLSKARARFGKVVFEAFFEQVLQLCLQAGLVSGEKLFADSTLVDANASIQSLAAREEVFPVQHSPAEHLQLVYSDNPPDPSERTPKSTAQSPADQPQAAPTPEDESRSKRGRKPKPPRPRRNDLQVSRTDPDAAVVSRPGMKTKLAYKEHFGEDPKKHGPITSRPAAGGPDARGREPLQTGPKAQAAPAASQRLTGLANRSRCGGREPPGDENKTSLQGTLYGGRPSSDYHGRRGYLGRRGRFRSGVDFTGSSTATPSSVLCRQPLWSGTGIRGPGTSPHSGGDSPAIAPDATSQGRTFASFRLPVRSRAGCLRLPPRQGSAPGGLRSPLEPLSLSSACLRLQGVPNPRPVPQPQIHSHGHPISPPGSDRAGRGPLADTRRSANFPAEKEHRRMGDRRSKGFSRLTTSPLPGLGQHEDPSSADRFCPEP